MKWYEARLIDLLAVFVIAVLFLPAGALADDVKVITEPAPACWIWGGGSTSQGQFSNCNQTVVVQQTVTKTVEKVVEKRVEVPVPVPVTQKKGRE